MRAKYSIILPTLNGAKTLTVTLPAMLRIDRDDVEWVISENHSDDDTWSTLREIVADDERVRLVRPPQRLPLGKHLEFAYQHATGRWLSHLGDDDHLLPWRFELLDQALEAVGQNVTLLRGEYVRYSWPEYPEANLANSIDPATFRRSLQALPGHELAAQLLNQSHVHGGGSWVVRSDVVQAVRRRCGYFASPQHVEFFAMRAAAALSEQAALVGLPLFILGRHNKSSGTQYFLPKHTNREGTWDWSFEDPEHYGHCPFNWKSYSTLSLDGALAVQQLLREELGDIDIDWPSWCKTIHSEMLRLVAYGQLPPQVKRDFLTAVASVPAGSTFAWRWRTLRISLKQFLSRTSAPIIADAPQCSHDTITFHGQVLGDEVGFGSITEVPAWLQEATSGRIASLATVASTAHAA